MNKYVARKLEEQVITAFSEAIKDDYISDNPSEDEVKDNIYEILTFMPSYKVEQLTSEEYKYAVEVLLSQVV